MLQERHKQRRSDFEQSSGHREGFTAFLHVAASFPRLSRKDEERIGRAIHHHRIEWERALFTSGLGAKYAVTVLQRYIDSKKRIDRFCDPLPGKQKHLKQRMQGRLAIVTVNLKLLYTLLARTENLYKIAISKNKPIEERKNAWKQLGRDKEKIANLLIECKLRFHVLKRIHEATIPMAEKTLAHIEQLRQQCADEDQQVVREAIRCVRREAIQGLLLSKESGASLATRCKRSIAAYNAMTLSMKELSQSNLLLVANIAKKYDRAYRASGKLIELLTSAGEEGLMRAVEKFEWKRRFKFSTYATPWIKQAIRKELPRLKLLIHVPAHRQNAARDSHTGLELSHVEQGDDLKARRSLERIVSLDSSSEFDGEGRVLKDILASSAEDVSTTAYRHELRTLVQEAIKRAPLTERERSVIGWRFFESQTLEWCSLQLLVTKERIRQIETKAKGKIERQMRRSLLITMKDPAVEDPGLLQW